MSCQSFTGLMFEPMKPSADAISIIDIAHALSNICRYNGHCSEFYSVAQHSVYVSNILKDRGEPPHVQLQGLLHDATEAYLGDVVSPLKRHMAMEEYRHTEDAWEKVIANKFGFNTLTPFEVKQADMSCLVTEARDLMNNPTHWPAFKGYDPLPWKVVPILPEEAELLFLRRFNELMVIVNQFVEDQLKSSR